MGLTRKSHSAMGASCSVQQLPHKSGKCHKSFDKRVNITRMPLGLKLQEYEGDIEVVMINDGYEAQKAGIVVGDRLVSCIHESLPDHRVTFNGIYHSHEILAEIQSAGIGVSNPLILHFKTATRPVRPMHPSPARQLSSKLQRANSFPTVSPLR
jgi:hypothetical protein